MTTQAHDTPTAADGASVARADPRAFEPADFDGAAKLATALVRSGLMPTGLDTPEKVVVAIMMGRELGMTTMQSVRLIHVIEGKPCLSAAGIVGLVKASAACLYFDCVETTDQIATYETQRRGSPKPVRMGFTLAQARTAGLLHPLKSGKPSAWMKFPAAMLRARAETALARSVYADVVGGLYDPDEVLERVEPAEPRDVTPPTPVVATIDPRPTPKPNAAAAAPEILTTAELATETAPRPPNSDDGHDAHDAATGEVPLSYAARSFVERYGAVADRRAYLDVGRDVLRAGLTAEELAVVRMSRDAAKARLWLS